MTRDDIIRMAREADFAEGLSDTLRGVALVWDAETKHLERFALLVRDQMLSEGWRQCAQGQRTTQHCAVAEQARQEEREACAQECDAVSESANKAAVAGQYLIIKNGAEARRCAAAIRARSKT